MLIVKILHCIHSLTSGVLPSAMPNIKFTPATPTRLSEIRQLAVRIWHAHYPGIITRKQIDYMLDRDYAVAALAESLDNQVCIDLLEVNDEPMGFAAWGPSPVGAFGPRLTQLPSAEISEAKLHKLYLDPSFHGQGLGSMLLNHVLDRCRAAGTDLLSLAVNKHNTKAIRAYARNGFTTVQSVFVDIGDGYYMDDFIMARAVGTNAAPEATA